MARALADLSQPAECAVAAVGLGSQLGTALVFAAVTAGAVYRWARTGAEALYPVAASSAVAGGLGSAWLLARSQPLDPTEVLVS